MENDKISLLDAIINGTAELMLNSKATRNIRVTISYYIIEESDIIPRISELENVNDLSDYAILRKAYEYLEENYGIGKCLFIDATVFNMDNYEK